MKLFKRLRWYLSDGRKKKIQLLQLLKADVLAHGVIVHDYANEDGGCCVVGLLLRRLGMSHFNVMALNQWNLYQIMTYEGNAHPYGWEARRLLDETGLRFAELQKLMIVNDEEPVRPYRNIKVMNAITQLIAAQ